MNHLSEKLGWLEYLDVVKNLRLTPRELFLLEDNLRNSKIMKSIKSKEIAAIRKLPPSEKLKISLQLSELCLGLMKAGKRNQDHALNPSP